MEVHLIYFSTEKAELTMTISRNGVTATPLHLTFPEFRYLTHRLREIEEGILPPERENESKV